MEIPVMPAEVGEVIDVWELGGEANEHRDWAVVNDDHEISIVREYLWDVSQSLAKGQTEVVLKLSYNPDYEWDERKLARQLWKKIILSRRDLH